MTKRIETDMDIETEMRTAPKGSRACRVCKCVTAESALDCTGRCASCAAAKAATDAGTTYGKWQGKRYAAYLETIAQQERLERELHKKPGMSKVVYCLNCRGVIPESSSYEKFCCRECRSEWEKKERDAQERGAIKEKKPQQPPAPQRHCLQCGKELPGRKKYCDSTCKYLFNQTHLRQRAKERAKEKTRERPILLCRYCGKEIFSTYRSVWCSPECAKAGHNEQKRQKRAKAKKKTEEA